MVYAFTPASLGTLSEKVESIVKKWCIKETDHRRKLYQILEKRSESSPSLKSTKEYECWMLKDWMNQVELIRSPTRLTEEENRQFDEFTSNKLKLIPLGRQFNYARCFRNMLAHSSWELIKEDDTAQLIYVPDKGGL